MRNNASKISLAIIELFNGLSGLFGGFGLISDPSGLNLGMKTSWLEASPFESYLIPGIILFLFNGVGNSAGFIFTIRKNKIAGRYAVFFGIIMMIWIITQVALIGYKSFLQPLYFSTGLIQLLLGFWFIKSNQVK